MSRQTGLDVRYYTCRKCGVEYGWLSGSLYDGVCYAPKEIRLVATAQSIEQEVKDLNEAISYLYARGGIVTFPDGIKDPNEEKGNTKTDNTLHPDERGVSSIFDIRPRIDKEHEGKKDIVEDKGNTERHEDSNKLSLDDLFKAVKEPPKDESNS
jgi:hypothetical protein